MWWRHAGTWRVLPSCPSTLDCPVQALWYSYKPRWRTELVLLGQGQEPFRHENIWITLIGSLPHADALSWTRGTSPCAPPKPQIPLVKTAPCRWLLLLLLSSHSGLYLCFRQSGTCLFAINSGQYRGSWVKGSAGRTFQLRISLGI